MRYFLDTEFYEHGYARIDLISIALVCEDGREFYAVASDGWDPSNVNEWLKTNVLPHLGGPMLPRREIATQIRAFVLSMDRPEFWAYFADYDWVVFCQLFGTMLELPHYFPKYCRDIKQLQDELGVVKSSLPKLVGTEHNALDDARHVKAMHDHLRMVGVP